MKKYVAELEEINGPENVSHMRLPAKAASFHAGRSVHPAFMPKETSPLAFPLSFSGIMW